MDTLSIAVWRGLPGDQLHGAAAFADWCAYAHHQSGRQEDVATFRQSNEFGNHLWQHYGVSSHAMEGTLQHRMGSAEEDLFRRKNR